MLSNEVFALACRAYYEEQGLIVNETNGQFAHCPQPERYGDAGYYLLWEHHQHQGLLQSRDIGECCFFIGHAKKWLIECDYFPDNYFELWDIYDTYSKDVAKHLNDPGLREKTIKASQTKEAKEKRVKTWKEKGLTCDHLKNPEVRSRARRTMLKFWDSSEGQIKRGEIRNRRAPRAQYVEITFPDGRIGAYSTVKLASIALGVSTETIRRLVKNVVSKNGKMKGYLGRVLN